MLVDWYGMVPSTNSLSDKSPPDVLFVMESGISSLKEKLQSCELAGPSVVIVLCSTYPSASIDTTYGSLRVAYVPQPYGPLKIAKAFAHSFHSIGTETESASQNIATPLLVSSAADRKPTPLVAATVPLTPRPADFAVVERPPVLPSAPPELLDRRTSIDTSIMQPSGMRVLLVEDNEINMKLLVAYMRKLKLNHTTAINGLEALLAYKETKGNFDVVFMDISMPIMSGIESARQIRRFERENSLEPVILIALTGAANPTTRQEAFGSGIDLYITKPVAMKSLKIMLDEVKLHGRQGINS